MNDINVGHKIRAFRKGSGLTSKRLAELADITPSMLSQIEKRNHKSFITNTKN